MLLRVLGERQHFISDHLIHLIGKHIFRINKTQTSKPLGAKILSLTITLEHTNNIGKAADNN